MKDLSSYFATLGSNSNLSLANRTRMSVWRKILPDFELANLKERKRNNVTVEIIRNSNVI